jgi:hypothetical protein
MNLPENLLLRLEALSPADQCLVHRYLYYVESTPVLQDREYDMLERMATNDPDTPVDHDILRPGSDLASSYPQTIVDLALQVLHRELW